MYPPVSPDRLEPDLLKNVTAAMYSAVLDQLKEDKNLANVSAMEQVIMIVTG